MDQQRSQNSQSNSSAATSRSTKSRSTLTNSFLWRMTHAISYLIGGLTFPFASISYFPAFARVVDSPNIAGWLYTIGSFFFLVADLIQWNHYRPACFASRIQTEKYKIGFNFLLSAVGSLFYLIGSIFFIPATDALEAGQVLFIVGSAVITFSQTWKCIRTCTTPHVRSALENIRDDISGFCVDFFAGFGGLLYFVGTILFSKADTITDPLYVPAVVMFTLGGLAFLISALTMQRRYFFRPINEYGVLR